MKPTEATELAADLIAEGLDVQITVTHSIEQEGNAPAAPDAQVRVIAGQRQPEARIPVSALDKIREREGLTVATADLLIG